MAFENAKYREALSKVLHNFGKAKWIESADLGHRSMRVRFSKEGEEKMLLLSELMKQVKWPTDKYQILAFTHLAKMLNRKHAQQK
jgi:hypothetical protein